MGIITKKTATNLTSESVSILTQQFEIVKETQTVFEKQTVEENGEVKEVEVRKEVEIDIERQVGSNYRCAYSNSASGREMLAEGEPEEIVAQVMEVWGDTPTVEEPDFSDYVPTPSLDDRVTELEETNAVLTDDLLNTQLALTEQYEANIVLEEDLLNTQLALTEQYEANLLLEEIIVSMQKDIEDLKAANSTN